MAATETCSLAYCSLQDLADTGQSRIVIVAHAVAWIARDLQVKTLVVAQRLKIDRKFHFITQKV